MSVYHADEMKASAIASAEAFEKERQDGFRLNRDRLEAYASLFDLIKVLEEDADVKDIVVNIDGGVFSIVVDEVLFEHGRSHLFFNCLSQADAVRLSTTKDEDLQIVFCVKDLWVKV